jgi:NAD+ synthase
MTGLRRDGVVVPISGGLDSSTVAALCVRAVGRERVTGLMLPEKNGSRAAGEFGKQLAASLGIRTATIDMSPILKALGTYQFVTESFVPRGMVRFAIQQVLPAEMKRSSFMAGLRGTGSALVRQGRAAMYSKHRIRMVLTFKYAEERNLLVAGSAHKSEDLVGLFSKFGVDDNADVMPLKHLYRSHIVQLARYCGVPEEIIARSPNPDMVPGIDDKYHDMIGIPAETVDLVLLGLEKGLAAVEIARQLALSVEKVDEVAEMMRLSEHMRSPSYSL